MIYLTNLLLHIQSIIHFVKNKNKISEICFQIYAIKVDLFIKLTINELIKMSISGQYFQSSTFNRFKMGSTSSV